MDAPIEQDATPEIEARLEQEAFLDL